MNIAGNHRGGLSVGKSIASGCKAAELAGRMIVLEMRSISLYIDVLYFPFQVLSFVSLNLDLFSVDILCTLISGGPTCDPWAVTVAYNCGPTPT